MFGYGSRVSDVSSDLDTLRTDLSRLANTVGNILSNQTRSAQDDLQDGWFGMKKRASSHASDAYSAANDWSKQGSAWASDARDRLSDANSEIESRISSHPIAAVLIAAGIGMAIGLMSRSR
jgi:ElaB/YqjD/DUF883 family membrane-anchored ribosome-binding protein